MANQSKFDILSLPNLVTDHIFSYLGGASLHRARQVCKQWNSYIVERLWKIPYNRRQMTNRMERTWRQGDGDLNTEWLDLEFPDSAYVDCYSSELMAIRSRMGTDLRNVKLQIFNALDNTFWAVPQPFHFVADRALGNNYRLYMSDSLLGIRVQLKTAEHLENLVVWSIKEKDKILDENIALLRHVQTGKTKEHSDIMVLFTRNYIDVCQFETTTNISRIRVAVETTAHFDGNLHFPYLMQVFDSPDLVGTALTVWTMEKEPLALEKKIVVEDLDEFFHMENGDEIIFPVEDIVYLGQGFLISCQIPLPGGPNGSFLLCFRIIDDNGNTIKQYNLPEFSSDAYVNFYLFEKRLVVTIDDYVMVYKDDTDQLCDPNFTRPIDFQILDDLQGNTEVMLRKVEASTVSIVTFFGGMQMIKKRTLNFWSKE